MTIDIKKLSKKERKILREILLTALATQVFPEIEENFRKSRTKRVLNPSLKSKVSKVILFEDRLKEIKLTKEEERKLWLKACRKWDSWFTTQISKTKDTNELMKLFQEHYNRIHSTYEVFVLEFKLKKLKERILND